MTLDELAKEYPPHTKIKHKGVPMPAKVLGVTFGLAVGEPVLVVDLIGDGHLNPGVIGHIRPEEVEEIVNDA